MRKFIYAKKICKFFCKQSSPEQQQQSFLPLFLVLVSSSPLLPSLTHKKCWKFLDNFQKDDSAFFLLSVNKFSFMEGGLKLFFFFSSVPHLWLWFQTKKSFSIILKSNLNKSTENERLELRSIRKFSSINVQKKKTIVLWSC